MDVKKLLKDAEGEPAGIVAHGSDGRLFFLTNEQCKQFEIPDSRLYAAYRSSGPHPGPVRANSYCRRLKKWLDAHSPNSAKWRALCLAYFEDC
jgi:hypothetical protein